MRQHVNPLSKNYSEIEVIPPLNVIFGNSELPLHLDVGCASGDFLFDLALKNKKWNYLGIEIRQKLVKNANLKLSDTEIQNLYFSFGNANNIFNHDACKFLFSYVKSISFNFPDPWFKKKHYKRRVIQTDLINLLSNLLKKGSLIFVKTDVKDLFDYIDFTILSNLSFKAININHFNYFQSFNPYKIETNREKYVKENNLNIFEKIYIKT